MRKVTWDDLTMNISDNDIHSLYEDWTWLVTGMIKPLMVTKFGDLFYQTEDGNVHFLDTIEGRIVDICSSENEFVTFINQNENVENYLLSYIVFDLVNQDKIPNKQQCYSFVLPPILGGKIESGNVQIMDFVVSVSLTGQIHRQVKDLPEGAQILGFKIEEN